MPQRFTDVRLTGRQHDMITQLLHVGIYGETHDEVIGYLIRRSLDDILRAGTILEIPLIKVVPTKRGKP